MEQAYHRKVTKEIIQAVYPEIDQDVMSCIVRSSLLNELRELFRRRRELHFDRIPYGDHESTWDIGILEIRYRLMRYRWNYNRRKFRRACRQVGILINMIEDFFCHSNAFDLPEYAQEETVSSLIRLGPYPSFEGCSLMFTSYTFFQRMRRRDDGYSHSRTLGSYPSGQELDIIAQTTKQFFSHYGIIV